jgi:hypothetical protein
MSSVQLKLTGVLLFVVGCRGAEASPHLQLSPVGSSERGNAVAAAQTAQDLPADAELDSNGGVLVELFTSEGCSSCPPADEVLADLARRADAQGEPVIPVAFHVDYWNDLGWVDPFSLPDSSDRQRWYASVFETRSIYTPQMIVAGTRPFVGSNRSALERNLHAALSTQDDHPALHLTGGQRCEACADKSQRSVSVRVETFSPSQALVIALVQRRARSQVTRGENQGSTLEHSNVVRAFTVRDRPAHTNDWGFTVPAAASQETFAIVAFLQELQTGRATKARRWLLPS